ncbi:unnamed protein product [Arctia plantaginis]|uniref:C2H2-type domain-containing protein n=1 Tax=Arctia plantaginis TaxID=874455 RepID=A0A8S0ZKN0_ARCPL|nr:unnamed protein product [Arctia plantaginis]
MDKNTYETYEFLPANPSETEPEQFFVVQDDGSFLLNRQIQYVAQVEDVKEVLEDVQPCTVYGVGVPSQQFFVDVDNSTELISVSDQFILPDGENSLYTNSYLLQPSSSTTTEEVESDVVADQFKEANSQEEDIDIATHDSKQGNNFTEITISDEQYQTLEQKGWILLESNDKIFVLNTLGLHDITSNDRLIQKLRNEIQNSTNSENNPGTIKLKNVSSQFPNLVAQSFTDQQDTMEFVIGSNVEQDDNIKVLKFVVHDNKENIAASCLNVEQMDVSDSNQESEFKNNINEIAIIKQESINDTSSIKIKTKFNFKDIPEKIVLGKTLNGKRLVAKVVKTVSKRQNMIKPAISNECKTENIVTETVTDNSYNNNNGLSETELVSLIQHSVRSTSQTKLSVEDVTSAHSVIGQLLKVPNIESLLVGHNLIITKVKNNKEEPSANSNRRDMVLMTGHVTEDEDCSSNFEHLPDLLQSIKAKSVEAMTNENQHLECIDHEKETCTIFHVHITETKCPDRVTRVSVTLNKRQLSLNQMFDLKRRHPHTVFACSACAALFKSEEALKEHQENDCLESDEILTIDTDKIDMVDAYSIIKTEKNKYYKCKQCDVHFSKLYPCVRHVKTHLGLHLSKPEANKDKELTNEQGDKDKPKTRREVFKCKMCPSTYFHPSTLSKHIVTRHIKVKAK